jgi:hypothetical protein
MAATGDPMTHPHEITTERHRSERRRRRTLGLFASLALLAGLVLAGPMAAPASAAPVIDAQSIVLDISATCEKGNVNITYDGTGIDRQAVDFTSEDGTHLDLFDVPAYRSDYDGLEYILTKAGSERGRNQPVPAPGTRLGVYVMLGDAVPTAANAEFFLLYRCDGQRNDRGGDNVVLQQCVGPYGTCPKTAVEALAPPTTTTTEPVPMTSTTSPSTPPAATPVVATPTFAG